MNPNPNQNPNPQQFNEGEDQNIRATFRALFDKMPEIDQRANIGADEKRRLKVDNVIQIFDYAINQRNFLSRYPGFRLAIRQKAGEFRDDGAAPRDIQEKANEVISMLDNLEAQPGVIRGGKRRARKSRKTRKGRKSRKGRKGTRRH